MSEEKKERAGLLDTLSFSLLDQPTLVKKLSAMFIKVEDSLRNERSRRRGWEVNERSVTPWLRTVYTAPRGSTATTVKEIITEVARQKVLRAKRAEMVAYLATYGKKLRAEHRRNAVAASLYTIHIKGYNEKREAVAHSCSFLSSYGEWLVGFQTGGYYRDHVLFVRNKRTGRSSLVNVGRNNSLRSDKLHNMLYDLIPDHVRPSIFKGVPILVDFDALTINIGNQGIPIKHGSVSTSDGSTIVSMDLSQ